MVLDLRGKVPGGTDPFFEHIDQHKMDETVQNKLPNRVLRGSRPMN